MKKILALCLFGSGIVSACAGSIYADANVGVNTGNNNTAVGADAGYMFNSFLGVEGGIIGSNDVTIWDGAVKGVLPLGLIDIYGKLGLAYINNSGYTNPGLLYGGGIAFPIAPMFQLRVEDYAITGNGNPNFLMFGAQFSF